MKQARQLAQKTIRQAQKGQKYRYDKTAKEKRIEEGDIVMLKVEPRFKLDHPYKGPYRVKEVTPTNVFIQQINDPGSEVLDVSIQRVSKCSTNLETAAPWLGHSGKSRRRCQLWKVQTRRSTGSNKVEANLKKAGHLTDS